MYYNSRHQENKAIYLKLPYSGLNVNFKYDEAKRISWIGGKHTFQDHFKSTK